MWADRYLKLTLKLKFQYNVKLVFVVVETPKISVNTMYGNSIGELVNSPPQSMWCM